MRCKTRESPALDVIELLRQKGADVRYHDPYVLSIRHNGFEMAGETALSATLRLGFPLPLVGDSLWSQGRLLPVADCAVVMMDHSRYDWAAIRGQARLVVDTRHVPLCRETRPAAVKLKVMISIERA